MGEERIPASMLLNQFPATFPGTHGEFWLQRFHSCYIPKPRLQSGIFLKKMPPSASPTRAHSLWNRSGVVNY
jgi:hypothetical protein